ncbi:MAG: DNA polymerase III subunit gamma/tau [Candidatus Viridilinea halotolerans]|uniref:DNA polymerase III subunit gamma/tau n=1 Tax=Candidatus Viridilinea halotolerans TaxID=2491704 RepID=A0A426U7D3_9CHLR|nr:MAG: DNA polymerase III subunit gamma/tau [Candidatus Viridilinea halotolerans]
MASQSLYRKWRSQTFAELVGQEHVVQTLRNAIVEERVAHAYLFTGPRGVGKTSMARLLAKAVNCLASDPTQRPCGQCTACTSIAEGRAVDVIEMDAASNTSVDDARELIERVQFRPAELRSKVYVIDETHMLSTAAFNALLKTLEEPPDHAIFILATTEVHKVPATILSRCQRFTFTRHGVASTASHLRRIAEAEGLTLAEGAPEAIARSATGSMRDALSVLEQLASFTSGAITLEQVHSLLGMTAAAEVFALIEALLADDAAAALHAVGGVADQGADVRQFTRDLVERLRSLLLLMAAGEQARAELGADEQEILASWATRAEVPRLLHWIKLFSGLDYQLRTSPYGHLPLELAVVEALVTELPIARTESREPRTGNREPRAGSRGQGTENREPRTASVPPRVAPVPPPPSPPRVESREQRTENREPRTEERVSSAESAPPSPRTEGLAETTAPPPVVTPPATGSTPSLPLPPPPPPPPLPSHSPELAAAANADFSALELVEAHWEEIKRDVRPRSPSVQALLHGARPFDVEGNTVILLATSPFHKDNIEKLPNRQIIEQVLKRYLGGNYAVRCTIEARTDARERDLRGQIREARQDELVRAAMNIFEAHIVDIESEEQP